MTVSNFWAMTSCGISSMFTFSGESAKNERNRCGGICKDCYGKINLIFQKRMTSS